ncbi:hypothetical protein AGMMS49545_18450 [Betaproteobacteria bacterium]|nr:hypothetical protein AGMMS49545_18450 [Betaproteobacteria bacterium]GHU47552.1 hypothetical protein AGMMS50289_22920 [Betaproteobacteria bacterium]
MMKNDLSRLSPSSQQKALEQQLKELRQLELETVKATRNTMERGASNEVIKNNELLRENINSTIGRTASSLEAETGLQKGKAATREMNKTAATTRASAITRSGSVILDVELQLLNPDAAESTGIILLRGKLDKYEREGIISSDSYCLLVNELGSQPWVVTGVLNLLDADMKKRGERTQINDGNISDYMQNVKKTRGVE